MRCLFLIVMIGNFLQNYRVFPLIFFKKIPTFVVDKERILT